MGKNIIVILNIFLFYMNKAVYFLRKLTQHLSVLESYTVDGHTIKIVDELYYFHLFPEKRIMQGDTGLYSAIFKSRKYINQPAYPEIQTIIELWNKKNFTTNYLILGCAGCAIPRFIINKYSNSKIIGVEKSDLMIAIAKKYFFYGFEKNNFKLEHADAFDFLNNNNLQQDVTFVDLFDNSEIVKDVYDKSFIENLSKASSEKAIVIYNFYGQNIEQGKMLCKIADNYFNHTILCLINYELLPIFINDDNIDAFINELKKLKRCRILYSK